MENQRGVVYALSVSSRSDNTLWAGTDDGLVWRTQDGGQNWSNITPPALTAWSKVTQIDSSHFDDDTAYVSVSRLRVDDLRPYIFKTHDGGATWKSISEGLPEDAAVNAVREDTKRKGLLFAATEKAVWISWDDGVHWSSLQGNLPHTSMRDLWIHEDDLIVGTHGRSIWILDDISVLRQLGNAVPREVVLVRPAPAYRVAQSTWTDTPIPPDEPLGTNPPAGAALDYFLPQDARGAAELEILDAKGNLVRRFSSTDALRPTAEELARELIPAYWLAQPVALPATHGLHRWIWDLHYPDPQTTERGYPISALPHSTTQEPKGPTVLPGTYIVRLTVDRRSAEAPLIVKPDPREKAPASALEQQFELATQLCGLLSDSSRAVLTARSEHSQLQALMEKVPKDGVIASFDKKVADMIDPLSNVQGDIDTLYKEAIKGGAAPTSAEVKATTESGAKLTPLLSNWQKLQTELPAVNKALRAAGLSQLHPELTPPRNKNVADEE
jgi:hypothetical protein